MAATLQNRQFQQMISALNCICLVFQEWKF